MECIFSISEQTLDLAKDLAAQPDSQVALRAAIGRAYYAAFYYGQILADKCPDPENRMGGMHEQVVRRLEEVPKSSFGCKKTAESIRRIGRWLRTAKALRVQADYELDSDVVEDDFKKAEKMAFKIARDAKLVLGQLQAA